MSENTYKPSKNNQETLDWVLEKIKALPYKCDSRWAFYNVLQRGHLAKGTYKWFIQLTSRARKAFWNGWAPDTLQDSNRSMLHVYGMNYHTVKEWLDSMKGRRPRLSIEDVQEKLIYVMFEARTMANQFEYYLGNYRICLVPFGGDPSLDLKWSIAKDIERIHEATGKHIIVLYFGDYDAKGKKIPESALEDVRRWCSYKFEYHHLGIHKSHVKKFNIPLDPETGSKYQWQALTDEQAREMIEQVFQYWSKDDVESLKESEDYAEVLWSSVVDDAIAKAKQSL